MLPAPFAASPLFRNLATTPLATLMPMFLLTTIELESRIVDDPVAGVTPMALWAMMHVSMLHSDGPALLSVAQSSSRSGAVPAEVRPARLLPELPAAALHPVFQVSRRGPHSR